MYVLHELCEWWNGFVCTMKSVIYFVGLKNENTLFGVANFKFVAK